MAWQGASPNRIRGRRWMAIRARILARDPICKECERQGRVTKDSLSRYVDHIVSLAEGGTNDDENLEGQCAEHYKSKVAQESATARSRQPPRPKPSIALDGWPEDS